MKQSKLISISGPYGFLKVIAWVFLILFAGRFVVKDALPYFGMDPNVLGRYWDLKWWLIGHVSGGLLALVIGPFQFWKAFRNKYLKLHRWMGRFYLSAIVIGTISSTYLAWTAALAIHWTWAFALQGLAFAWICTAAMAYRAILQRKIEQHREWMIRSYVVTFAFVSFRFLDELPFVQSLGSFIEHAPTSIWVSWVIPLFITEMVLQWNKK
ncbi:DUF2306 domain-containing protein [Geojedonia litorea]|uniref:DUF2306 domain-containing protein n=1 Tax=Geojedonia litorea TaxID=1268269 RepID=A0ABV9MXY6_9FLAO